MTGKHAHSEIAGFSYQYVSHTVTDAGVAFAQMLFATSMNSIRAAGMLPLVIIHHEKQRDNEGRLLLAPTPIAYAAHLGISAAMDDLPYPRDLPLEARMPLNVEPDLAAFETSADPMIDGGFLALRSLMIVGAIGVFDSLDRRLTAMIRSNYRGRKKASVQKDWRASSTAIADSSRAVTIARVFRDAFVHSGQFLDADHITRLRNAQCSAGELDHQWSLNAADAKIFLDAIVETGCMLVAEADACIIRWSHVSEDERP